MTRHTSRFLFLALTPALLLSLGGACAQVEDPAGADGEPAASADREVATVSFELTAVAAGIHCVRFSAVSGTRMQEQKSTVTPGNSSIITFSGLPPGPCKLSVDAFTQACSSVSSTTAPAWLSDSVMATLAAGENTPVSFALRPAAGVNGSLDFISLVVTPSALNFGDVAVGTTSAPQSITIKNIGGSTSSVSLGLTGSGAVAFALGPCASLAAGASCVVPITFHPGAVGQVTVQLNAIGTPGGTVTATLSGRGAVPAQLALSPAAADFHSGPFGGSDTLTFTVSNLGGLPTGPLTVDRSGPDAAQFAIVGNGCPAVLASGASCAVAVQFTTGGATSDKHATLTLSASPGGTAMSQLTGHFGF
jgi:hypothetical protein